MMADNKNMELNDEMMAKAAGGTADADPYGFLCEATVISGPGSASNAAGTDYSVNADNGKSYIAAWPYAEILNIGDRVQLIHNEDGFYSLEPIPNEG
jgi:hypothetical protein